MPAYPLLQDISFIFKEYESISDINNNSILLLLHDYLIKQFRNSNTLFKKYYSENFNLIYTLKNSNFTTPYDVKTNYKFIFIASKNLNRVSVFHRLTREHFTNIDISGCHCTTIGLDSNNENDLYITGYNHQFIYHYRYNNLLSTFEFIKKFNGEFSWITNIVIDKQLIYCVERYRNKISILNKDNGQLVREIKNNYTSHPWNIALTDKDYFFLTSLKLDSVSKLSLTEGTLIKSYEGIEGATGMIINDKTNHLIVCCYSAKVNEICVFDCKTLELIREITGDFNGIICLDIDCDGNLYVSENNTSNIKIFN